jgi:hypothetical protein
LYKRRDQKANKQANEGVRSGGQDGLGGSFSKLVEGLPHHIDGEEKDENN